MLLTDLISDVKVRCQLGSQCFFPFAASSVFISLNITEHCVHDGVFVLVACTPPTALL